MMPFALFSKFTTYLNGSLEPIVRYGKQNQKHVCINFL
jgi:hypothetical protein